jgi:HTH-type transcriptional regulator/antitoxin HigA
VKSSFVLKGKARDRYLDLVREFPLTSIASDEHLSVAQHRIDRLLAKGQLREGEELYLDALSDLVVAYEDEHHAIPPASDADMLRHLMEAKGVTQVQLSHDTNIAKSTISEILRGKKPFSRAIMRKLADYFNVDIGVLALNI